MFVICRDEIWNQVAKGVEYLVWILKRKTRLSKRGFFALGAGYCRPAS